jgi:glucosylceramidase
MKLKGTLMKLTLSSTAYFGGKVKKAQLIAAFEADPGVENHAVNLYPGVKYQEIMGFGGAITEAAGYVFSKMSGEKQREILDAYYGQEGNQYTMARASIDSCDFSLGNYSAVTDPNDETFATFTLKRDEQYVLPLLRRAQETAKKSLALMLSPWSPPAFMKSNGQKNGGGYLMPEYYGQWASYICRYIKEYQARGYNIAMVTVQNEPKAVQKWDSCVYTAEEEKVFLRDFLYPALEKNNLTDVGICIWDHNKERVYERAKDIIDDKTNKMVKGVAFHWYSGEHFDAVRLVAEQFPDKKLVFTEGCVEYSRFGADDQLAHARMYAHDIIGNLKAGMHGYLDWNILLDEKGGPNHVSNYCEAPLMCDTKQNTVEKKLSFEYIGHFSRYIKPGAKRIASSVYTDKLDTVSFLNPDGTLVSVYLNKTGKALPVVIRLNGQAASFTLAANAIATGLIEGLL